MSLRLLSIALAVMFGAAVAAGQPVDFAISEDAVHAKHVATLRAVFREARAPGVLVSAIIYSSIHPEEAVALRQSGEGFEIVGFKASQPIWTYSVVELMRSGVIKIGTLRRGGGIDYRTDDEADRLAAGLPPSPLDVPLSRCAVPVEAELAEGIRSAWQNMLAEVPADWTAGGVGVMPVYMLAAGNEERELIYSQWSPPFDSASGRLLRIAHNMMLYCEDRNPIYVRQMADIAAGRPER